MRADGAGGERRDREAEFARIGDDVGTSDGERGCAGAGATAVGAALELSDFHDVVGELRSGDGSQRLAEGELNTAVDGVPSGAEGERERTEREGKDFWGASGSW